jgi:hypothetical protein
MRDNLELAEGPHRGSIPPPDDEESDQDSIDSEVENIHRSASRAELWDVRYIQFQLAVLMRLLTYIAVAGSNKSSRPCLILQGTL